MNELEFFLSLERNNRQTGRTTALAKACNEIGGIFVVHTENMKGIIKKQFPSLQVVSIGEKTALIGTTKPIILDHLTWTQVIANYNMESKKVRAEIEMYRRQLLRIKTFIEQVEL